MVEPGLSAAVSGRSIVVTGANSGVGLATTAALAGAGARVIMVCRDRGRGEEALQQVRQSGAGDVELEIADLSRLSDVRALGRRSSDRLDRVDVLINNAGVYRSDREMTADGLETTMATNHFGHFALTAALWPLIVAAAASLDGHASAGRVVNVSSRGHYRGKLRRAPLEAISRGEVKYDGWQAYCDSKLANVLFTRELARRFGDRGPTAHALHPGVLSTRIWNKAWSVGTVLARLFKPFMKGPSSGGEAVVNAVVHEGNGLYFDELTERAPADQALDEDLARELWSVSEQLTEVDWPG